ncbi:amidohydrolase family protein [Mesorhizobium yinganensis]|uniref:amidohydrolase family protein n=1 Tax=Mesorhizobium yinganensis TaxID=3157707 RepID=UPI0032B8019F
MLNFLKRTASIHSGVLSATLICLLCSPAVAQDVVIVGAKVYPSPHAPAIPDATVVVRGGVIAAVGPSDQVEAGPSNRTISGDGLVVVAGLWNSHVHLLLPSMALPPEENAEALSNELEGMLTRWGFTTVFDIASLPGAAIDLRRRIESGEVRGPNILTVDAPFFPNDGTPIYLRELLKGLPSMEVGTPDAASERVRRQLEAGADGVKIFAGAIIGGETGVLPMALDDAKAVVAEAHRHGKPAFAHPSNQEGLDVTIESGVDVLAHTTPDDGERWTPELVKRLTSHDIALIPTLGLWRVESEAHGLPAEKVEQTIALAQQQLGAFAAAGGDVIFGTDIGYIQTSDTSKEYQLMQGAGLSFEQILASLTTTPASRFGVGNKGKIEVGMDADLTVLAADPASRIEAFADVAYTIRGGLVIFRSQR